LQQHDAGLPGAQGPGPGQNVKTGFPDARYHGGGQGTGIGAVQMLTAQRQCIQGQPATRVLDLDFRTMPLTLSPEILRIALLTRIFHESIWPLATPVRRRTNK
jgi:hypothetical protein